MYKGYRSKAIDDLGLSQCAKCECLILTDEERERCLLKLDKNKEQTDQTVQTTTDGESSDAAIVLQPKCHETVKIYVKQCEDCSSEKYLTSTDPKNKKDKYLASADAKNKKYKYLASTDAKNKKGKYLPSTDAKNKKDKYLSTDDKYLSSTDDKYLASTDAKNKKDKYLTSIDEEYNTDSKTRLPSQEGAKQPRPATTRPQTVEEIFNAQESWKQPQPTKQEPTKQEPMEKKKKSCFQMCRKKKDTKEETVGRHAGDYRDVHTQNGSEINRKSSDMNIEEILKNVNCGKSGPCNTNTIIFPRDKSGGDGFANLENWLRSEAKTNNRSLEDILNELHKQRREMQELKDMLDTVVRGLREQLFMTAFGKGKNELFEDMKLQNRLSRKTNTLSITKSQAAGPERPATIAPSPGRFRESPPPSSEKRKKSFFSWCK